MQCRLHNLTSVHRGSGVQFRSPFYWLVWPRRSPLNGLSRRLHLHLRPGVTSGDLSYLDDTWTWDGASWTQQFPPVSPPTRGFNTEQMAFDAATGKVVLFGGFAPNGSYWGDTWVWDGIAKTWTQQFPASSPSPRGTTLAYDSATKQVIIFGGEDEGVSFLADTWTWDGITWTQQFPASSPSRRVNFAMAHDATIGEVVLFGGYSAVGGEALNDTWTWNGTTWSQIQTPITPVGRQGSWMDYDPNFKGLVLFGGYFTGGPYTNQTWLLTVVR
jgi:hypothetical protein